MTLGVHGAAMQAGAHMPLRKIADSGIVSAGHGRDIVWHYWPFTLGWVVSGLDVGGNRVLDETLTRKEALIAQRARTRICFFSRTRSARSKSASRPAWSCSIAITCGARCADQQHLADADVVGGPVVYKLRISLGPGSLA